MVTCCFGICAAVVTWDVTHADWGAQDITTISCARHRIWAQDVAVHILCAHRVAQDMTATSCEIWSYYPVRRTGLRTPWDAHKAPELLATLAASGERARRGAWVQCERRCGRGDVLADDTRARRAARRRCRVHAAAPRRVDDHRVRPPRRGRRRRRARGPWRTRVVRA